MCIQKCVRRLPPPRALPRHYRSLYRPNLGHLRRRNMVLRRAQHRHYLRLLHDPQAATRPPLPKTSGLGLPATLERTDPRPRPIPPHRGVAQGPAGGRPLLPREH